MVVSFLGIAGAYAALSAPFVAGIQVLVYAGAIAVLLLFAFMLTHDIMKPMEGPSRARTASAFAACTLLALVMARLLQVGGWVETSGEPMGQSLELLGQSFLTTYLVPFELVSVLLLTTLIGAVVVARKEEARPVIDQVSEDDLRITPSVEEGP